MRHVSDIAFVFYGIWIITFIFSEVERRPLIVIGIIFTITFLLYQFSAISPVLFGVIGGLELCILALAVIYNSQS